MVTDLSMSARYLATPEQAKYGRALIAMIGLCLFMQLLLTWNTRKKGPKRALAKELLIVLLAIKPGVEAYRVASGHEQPVYATATSEQELSESANASERSELFVCDSVGPNPLLCRSSHENLRNGLRGHSWLCDAKLRAR
jgi:hypothetical protein